MKESFMNKFWSNQRGKDGSIRNEAVLMFVTAHGLACCYNSAASNSFFRRPHQLHGSLRRARYRLCFMFQFCFTKGWGESVIMNWRQKCPFWGVVIANVFILLLTNIFDTIFQFDEAFRGRWEGEREIRISSVSSRCFEYGYVVQQF